ncbi:hypothetical protein JCM10908_003147 [Rhodotorula pacifica]|uniref:uncharacterized protein n=1 Tax=Rhodotorula pacifica TaxID=1495444 RepID=UPI003177A3F9
MSSLLDDLDPYGGAERVEPRENVQFADSLLDSTPGCESPVRLLDLSFLAAVTPRSAERSALIDFSVSPPPPLYPSSRPSTQPDLAPVHLLDDSFAVESPIRAQIDEDASVSAMATASRQQPGQEERENRPPRPARKRWSVMTRLREEKQQPFSRQSLSPIKDLSPLRAGEASVFLSPNQTGVVDLSLIADEGASFLAMADTSDTVSRLDHHAQAEQNQKQDRSIDSSSGISGSAEMEGESGGMSALLRGLDANDSGRSETGRDAALAQSSLLPAALTSSHRRALQQSIAPSGADITTRGDATFMLEEPSRAGDVSLLNCSTASFKDYRDSPRKPRLLSTHAEDWSLEEEDEEEEVETASDGGKTPRPPRRLGRVSDVTSEGDSFRLDGFQTSGFGTGILNQSPPTAALKPESTGTLRLELGLDVLESLRQQTLSSPPDSPVTDLASSTRTVVAATSSSRSSSRASTVIAEGDLLGVESLILSSASSTTESKLRAEVVPAAKAMSGAERLRRRLEELRAQKQQGASAAETDSSTQSARHASTSATSAFTTPGRRSSARPSLAPSSAAVAPGTTIGRQARPRLSALPAPATTSRSAAAPPATPGERKESTAMRLERLRSERKERETIRSATPGRPAASAGGLVRSASFVAPQRKSLASSTGSSTAGSARMPASRSLADLSSLAGNKAPAPAMSRTSLLPAPATSRRASLAPAEVPKRRMSLAPSTTAAAPSAPARSRPSLAPVTRSDLDRSLPTSTRTSITPASSTSSIRRSSSLQQISSNPVAGRRGSLAATSTTKPAFASIAPPRPRLPLKAVQPVEEELAGPASTSKDQPTSLSRAPSGRRLSRLARPSMGGRV